ncbi:MAG TPA: M3 family metallopeptidase [Gemmatimonadales bacterium]|nr:M3 family metallopeptidase [Gemmatimonadales bacterium]
MSRLRLLSIGTVLFMTACSTKLDDRSSSADSAGRANPFFTASALQYQAPPFDRITDADYLPAIEEGMKQNLAEIDAIAAQDSAPTFANTIEPMERSGELLTRVLKVFLALTQANTDSTLQQVQETTAPELAAFRDSISLNARLFQRIRTLNDQRNTLPLDPEQKFLVGKYYRDFVKAGALLSDADKTSLRAMNKEESELTTTFQNQLLAATNAVALVISDSTDLDGLTEGDRATAREEAAARKLPGKWVLVLRNTTQQPLLASLRNRAVRERLLTASMTRAEQGGANDTRATAQRLAELRAQKGKLLGYKTFADYQLDDQMAKTPVKAFTLLNDMVPAATAKARGEAARMQQIIDEKQGDFRLAAWDWQFYAEQVRQAEYDLNEADVKPYFELDRVLKDGVFFAAGQLYGLTFKERTDIPAYHPDVRVFEVFEADGTSLALFYADYFARPSKSGGAWMDSFVDQSGLRGTRPVVFNVANFTKPAAGQPALLSFDDVKAMFHEFGHALHGMFSNVHYPTLAGTNVPRDFVEFPSQFNEHWALEPLVFANYAKHYQSGQPMPASLVDKIKKSRTFDQGYATTEYLGAALLDMAWHTLPPAASRQDADQFESEALKRFKVDLPEVPPRYRTPYFAHIWDGGYSAGYYAYLWSEVLDHDAYYWFVEHGGMTRANGQRFRDMILSRGGTDDAAALYRAFRGRDPSVEPLLEQRGLKPGKI